MKRIRSAYFPKKFYYLMLLGTLILGPGCQKLKQLNPCDGLLGERAPTLVGLVLIDGQTGDNILLAKNIDASNIIITPEATGVPSESGMIVKESGSPMYGSLVFHIADTQKGTFKYKINVPNVGTTTLSYTNKEEKSNNKCNPYYITVTDPVIEGHQFTVTGTSYKILLKVTL